MRLLEGGWWVGDSKKRILIMDNLYLQSINDLRVTFLSQPFALPFPWVSQYDFMGWLRSSEADMFVFLSLNIFRRTKSPTENSGGSYESHSVEINLFIRRWFSKIHILSHPLQVIHHCDSALGIIKVSMLSQSGH